MPRKLGYQDDMEKGSEGSLLDGEYGPLWPLEPGVSSSSMSSAAQSIVGQ